MFRSTTSYSNRCDRCKPCERCGLCVRKIDGSNVRPSHRSDAPFARLDHSHLSHRPWQSLEHKPHAHCQFEKKDRTAVNPYRNNRRKLRKDDERVCAHSHQEGRDHSEAGQCSRNEARLEPQIAERGAAESGEHEADVYTRPHACRRTASPASVIDRDRMRSGTRHRSEFAER